MLVLPNYSFEKTFGFSKNIIFLEIRSLHEAVEGGGHRVLTLTIKGTYLFSADVEPCVKPVRNAFSRSCDDISFGLPEMCLDRFPYHRKLRRFSINRVKLNHSRMSENGERKGRKHSNAITD